jgi:hypothetical protein
MGACFHVTEDDDLGDHYARTSGGKCDTLGETLRIYRGLTTVGWTSHFRLQSLNDLYCLPVLDGRLIGLEDLY